MNLIIFGPQGSGKGTQAERLSEKYNLKHIETGQIFREIAKEETPIGKIILDIYEKKEMIPDDVTVDILRDNLDKVPTDVGLILDSAPRTMGQIEPVEKMLADLGRKLDKAIYISLPYEESILRISKRYMCSVCRRHFVLGKDILSTDDPCQTCGGPITRRSDDTPEGIAKRLDTFYEVTVPVIEHYRKKGMLIEVDGNQGMEDVFAEIVAKL